MRMDHASFQGIPSTFFGVETSLTIGEHKFMTCADFALVLMSTGAHTHLCLGSGALSSLDLTFCSPGTAVHFDWSVLPDLRGSDHYPVNLHMTAPSPTVSSPPKWITRRADWAGFSQSLAFEDQHRTPSPRAIYPSVVRPSSPHPVA
jgi:hypothetical protein